MEDQNDKKLYLTVFDFCKILRMREKNITKSANFFWLFFYIVQREDDHISSHKHKLKKRLGAKRSKSLVL